MISISTLRSLSKVVRRNYRRRKSFCVSVWWSAVLEIFYHVGSFAFVPEVLVVLTHTYSAYDT